MPFQDTIITVDTVNTSQTSRKYINYATHLRSLTVFQEQIQLQPKWSGTHTPSSSQRGCLMEWGQGSVQTSQEHTDERDQSGKEIVL